MMFVESACLPQDLNRTKELGFSLAIVEGVSAANGGNDPFVLATRRTIKLENTYDSVFQALVQARKEVDVVAIRGDDAALLRRLMENHRTMSRTIDVLQIDLDQVFGLKPSVVQFLLKHFGLVLELNLAQLLTMGADRQRMLVNARHVVRTLVRRRGGRLRLILTGYGKRSPSELCAIVSLFGITEADAEQSLSANIHTLVVHAKRQRQAYLEQLAAQASLGMLASLQTNSQKKRLSPVTATEVSEAQEEARKRVLLVKAWI
ncbi:hypothetical protein BASA81_001367 [Batrachochytrium salamandrivorans]|nr:hypothetical protein BASA81_001367 [Batrachochytrium salamandrivorans]